jgi:hypothetical protein
MDTITKLLNNEQKHFYALIAPYPYLERFWNWEKREVNIEQITTAITTMSHGEQLLAHFFVSVWLGRGRSTFSFDFVDAAAVLDKKERVMIATWLTTPFWP